LSLLWFALLARAIISWIPVSATNPVVVLIHQVTEPILQPIRRYMPRMGNMDLSPMVALILIIIVQRLIR
jgi:YggT family protein